VYEVFDRNDNAYQAWLKQNQLGYVINARRNLAPSYMVLHSAVCKTISKYSRKASAGAFTERAYVKICSNEIDILRQWVRNNGRPDGSFSKICGLCSPYPESGIRSNS
jgi:hypothetical protein